MKIASYFSTGQKCFFLKQEFTLSQRYLVLNVFFLLLLFLFYLQYLPTYCTFRQENSLTCHNFESSFLGIRIIYLRVPCEPEFSLALGALFLASLPFRSRVNKRYDTSWQQAACREVSDIIFGGC